MPVNVQDLIDIIAELAESRDLKATVRGSLQGGLVTGCSAVVGGLLLGPLGLAAGGLVGGLVAAGTSKGNFRSVVLVIRDMTPNQKQRLYGRVTHAFRNFGIQDMSSIAVMILSNTALQEIALRELRNYLSSEMNLKVM